MIPPTEHRYTPDSVVATCGRLGNIRSACAETGCPPYVAYIRLRKAGALAEREFQRLVPSGELANGYRLLPIPDEMFTVAKQPTLNPGCAPSHWWDLEVVPEELAHILTDAARSLSETTGEAA